jgi:hypothetical protein
MREENAQYQAAMEDKEPSEEVEDGKLSLNLIEILD